MFYLLIDRFEQFYVVKTNFIIRNNEQATRIAKEKCLIGIYNSIIRVEPISPIQYFAFLVKDKISFLRFA